MLLATVLDSFCIDNNIEICKKPVPFGRWQGIWTLATQDGPQYAIHLLFIFVVATEIPHSLSTVLMSLVCSSLAMPISIFNIVMCSQNEFDPIILEIEMKKRRDKASVRETVLQKKKDILKSRLSKAGPKSGMAQQMALIGARPKEKRMSTFYDVENFAREKKAIEDRSLQLQKPKAIEMTDKLKAVAEKKAPEISHDDIDFDEQAHDTIVEETARRETLSHYTFERKSARQVSSARPLQNGSELKE